MHYAVHKALYLCNMHDTMQRSNLEKSIFVGVKILSSTSFSSLFINTFSFLSKKPQGGSYAVRKLGNHEIETNLN